MRTRPTVTPEQMASPTLATRALNTQILDPLYNRLQQLEKQVIVNMTLLTKNPVGDTWPVVIPTPAFPVKSIVLANIWNTTTNSPEPLAGAVQWQVRPDGRVIIQWINLSASCEYALTLKVEG